MPRRILEGKVVSNKNDKTVSVLVERRYMHPVYKKYIKRTDKYAAHDEANICQTGDVVAIEECRPISKNKKWIVVTKNGEAIAAAPVEKKAESTEKAPAAKKASAKKTEEKKAVAKKAPAKKAATKKASAKKTVAKKEKG